MLSKNKTCLVNENSMTDEMLALAEQPEHWANPRLSEPFAAIVRGKRASGEKFEIHTRLEEFSAEEFCLQLARSVELGQRLFVITRIHRATVALLGTVRRIEVRAEEECVLVVCISHYRFLSHLETLPEIRSGPSMHERANSHPIY